MEKTTPAFYSSLDLIRNQIWLMMKNGVDNGKLATHTPSLATIGDNNQPQVRTVVLRGCDEENRRLRFHTDSRSPKVKELQLNPQIVVHSYSYAEKIQIKMYCEAELHASGPREEVAWAQTGTNSRKCYQINQAPSSTITAPTRVVYSDTKADEGRENFIVIIANIYEMEFLYLHHLGHRRAKFVWEKLGWMGTWLTP
ncbi:MAG: pyridoxamine 5'-phosphate oxidase family protein [Pseudomonadota bacterium]|nr:pyridoxamine 5'-phosphate oxidase family protein [Pseudomonadota bacterium]